MIRSFADLRVYKIAIELYPQLVGATRSFSSRAFHLKDQICRAGNSIPANIAEGFGRSAAEFKKYLTSAIGSCNELRAHLKCALDTNEISKNDFLLLDEKIQSLGKQIFVLRKNWH